MHTNKKIARAIAGKLTPSVKGKIAQNQTVCYKETAMEKTNIEACISVPAKLAKGILDNPNSLTHFFPDKHGQFVPDPSNGHQYGDNIHVLTGCLVDVQGLERPVSIVVQEPNLVTRALAKIVQREPRATLNLSY